MAGDAKSHLVTLLGVGLVAGLAAGVGYYVIAYKAQREHYFTESQRRRVEVLAEQVESAIDNRSSSLRHAVSYLRAHADSAADPHRQLEQQLKLAALSDVECGNDVLRSAMPVGCGIAASPPAALNHVPADGVQPRETGALDFSNTTCAGPPTRKRDAKLRLCFDPEAAAADQGRMPATPAGGDLLVVSNALGPLASYLPFTLSFDVDAVREVPAVGDALPANECHRGPVCAHVPLSALLAPFLRDDGFAEGEVFVARGKEILFEGGNGDVRLGSLNETRPKDDGKGTPTPASLTGSFPSAEEIAAGSIVRDVFFSGEWYRLFTHPMYVAGEDADEKWAIGYLVERHRFDRRVASLSFGSLSYLPLVVLIGLLAIPLLKIRTMGSRERLSATDVRVVALSIVALSGTVTTLGLAFYDFWELKAAVDGDLEQVSAKLRDNFTRELTDAGAALRKFAAQYAAGRSVLPRDQLKASIFDHCVAVSKEVASSGFACGRPSDDEEGGAARVLLRKASFAVDGGSGDGDSVPAAVAPMRGLYPFFDMVLFSDPDSRQKEKWSVGETATPLVQVETNASRDVKRGRLWTVLDRDGGRMPIALHLRMSSTTGSLVPLIATPVEAGDPQATGEPRQFLGTATMVPELSSLLRPVLPDGFSFAVVERDGTVVTHSDPSRSLYENFFEETDCSGGLRSVIESRGVDLVSGTYRGRAQKFHVRPIERTPWTLIVFRDLEVPRTVLLDALLTWFAVYGLYLLAIVVGVMLLRVLVGVDGAEWIWPDGYCETDYAGSLLTLMVITLFFVAVLIERPSSSLALLGTSLSLPLAAASHLYIRLTWSASARERQGTLGAASRGAAPWWAAWLSMLAAFALAVSTTLGDPVAMTFALGGVSLLAVMSTPVADFAARRPGAWLAVALAGVAGAVSAVFVGRFVGAGIFGLVALGACLVASGRHPSSRWLTWKHVYVWTGVVFVAIIGILPAVAFYEDVWDQSLEVFVRHGQAKTAERLDRRRLGIIEDYRARSLATPAGENAPAQRRRVLQGLADERRCKIWDIVPSSVFGGPSEPCCPPDHCAAADRQWTGSIATSMADGADGAGSSSELLERTRRIANHHFSSVISASLPVYHEESMAVRELLDGAAIDDRWHWQAARGKKAAFCWQAPFGGGVFRQECLEAPWPPGGTYGGLSAWWLVLLALAFLFGGLYAILRWLMSSLFGVGQLNWVEGHVVREPEFGRGVLLLRHGEIAEKFAPNVKVVNLRSLPKAEDLRDSIPDDVRVLLLTHLEERLEDLPNLEATLDLLESVLFRWSRPKGRECVVVVVSTVAPLSYLRRRLQSNADTEADRYITADVIGRWARLLESLARVDIEADRHVASLSVADVIEWWLALPPAEVYRIYRGRESLGGYAAETAQTPRLRGIAWEILWQRQIDSWKRSRPEVTPAEVAALIEKGEPSFATEHPLERLDAESAETIEATLDEAARAHYRSIWSHLTDDEQLALVQLSKEGYVNPYNWRLINGLLSRGVVHLTPAVRSMNEGFRRFVATEETAAQVRRWERADGRSPWEKTRTVILVVLIVVGLILYLTQPERLTQMVGVIGAIGGAAVTMANILGLFGGARPNPITGKP